MSDGLKSHLRTYWPVLLGYVSAAVVAAGASKLGLTISGETAYLVTGAVMTAVVYSLGRWLETRDAPVLRGIGRFLLSLGLDVGQPTYDPPRSTLSAPPRLRQP